MICLCQKEPGFKTQMNETLQHFVFNKGLTCDDVSSTYAPSGWMRSFHRRENRACYENYKRGFFFFLQAFAFDVKVFVNGIKSCCVCKGLKMSKLWHVVSNNTWLWHSNHARLALTGPEKTLSEPSWILDTRQVEIMESHQILYPISCWTLCPSYPTVSCFWWTGVEKIVVFRCCRQAALRFWGIAQSEMLSCSPRL